MTFQEDTGEPHASRAGEAAGAKTATRESDARDASHPTAKKKPSHKKEDDEDDKKDAAPPRPPSPAAANSP